MTSNMISKSLLAVALASSTVSSLAASKTRPPKIESISYGPAVVSTGSAFIATLTASDPLGVEQVTFSSYPNKGWWYPCSESKHFKMINGTTFDGTWQVECAIPAGTPNQMYAFNYNCIDTAGANTYETFKQGFQVTGGPDAEYTAPTIEKISCDDTVTAGSMLDVFLTIRDESGVETSMSYVKVHETTGNVVPCSSTEFVLESGVSTNGVFRASCLVPEGTPNGQYYLEVHVYDTQKNPAEQIVQDAFEVVGGAVPEIVPPTISNMKYANSNVERGQTLSVTATVSDAQSGVNHVNYQAREPYSQELLCQGSMFLQSGDSASGVWAFSCEVPLDIDFGYYSGSFNAFDNQNNQGMSSAGFNVVSSLA